MGNERLEDINPNSEDTQRLAEQELKAEASGQGHPVPIVESLDEDTILYGTIGANGVVRDADWF